MDQAEIDEWVAPRAKEIDQLKQEEARVMIDINEEVEGLRKLSEKRFEAEVCEKMGQMQIYDDDDEY